MKKYLLTVMLLLSSIAFAQITHVKRSYDTRTEEQYQADCAAGISLSSCNMQPISTGCEQGKHWSLEGSRIAHCVWNDMECPAGYRLEHDLLGNPSCRAIVCPPYTIWNGIQCVLDTPQISPSINTWSGQVTASTMCGRASRNGNATGCKANLSITITNWLQNNVSMLASQNSEVHAAIQYFYANCPTILRSNNDEKYINFTSSNEAVKGFCRTRYEPDLMTPKPGQIKYDSISNWTLTLTNIPR